VKTAVPTTRPYREGGVPWAAPREAAAREGTGGWRDDTGPAAEPDPFRAAMRHHAKGVAVITAGTEHPVGFCATSLASVSLEPPLASFTVGLRSSSWATIETARHVMVHLLADGQADLASRFARRDAAKFGADTRWHRNELGLPVLEDVLAWLQLELTNRFRVGDHALVIGQVIGSGHGAPGTGRPLIHLGGEFVTLAASRADR
jgi:flavin reductase (DIM6/NTAB) family NADH-FMN oxidoreductase RutF